MKKIIADEGTSIYQICKCFRNGESEGRIHASEFTMLEYYTVDTDYLGSLDITEALFEALIKTTEGLHGNITPPPLKLDDLRPPFLRMTVNEAFRKYAGFDLYESVRNNTLREEAQKHGITNAKEYGIPVLFDLLFVAAVEPNLPKEKPLFLMDYPLFVPALACANEDGVTRQRWELYGRGVELANCYTEERDPLKVKQFFDEETAEKNRRALVPHKTDEQFWKIFDRFPHFPPCSGVALGLDRLLMLFMGREHI